MPLYRQALHQGASVPGGAAARTSAGETREQILKAYPYLEPEDIDEALRYAAFLAEDEPPLFLSLDEKEAIARSRWAAALGEFAVDEEVRAVWAKHGLKQS